MDPNARSTELHDCRDAFTGTLMAIASEDKDVVAVCNDSVGSSKLGTFQATVSPIGWSMSA